MGGGLKVVYTEIRVMVRLDTRLDFDRKESSLREKEGSLEVDNTPSVSFIYFSYTDVKVSLEGSNNFKKVSCVYRLLKNLLIFFVLRSLEQRKPSNL